MTKTMPTYSAEISGLLTLYVSGEMKFMSHTFHIEPCEGQWTVGVAKDRAEKAICDGDTVLILNASGQIVFKADRGHVEFPSDQKRFWEGAGK